MEDKQDVSSHQHTEPFYTKRHKHSKQNPKKKKNRIGRHKISIDEIFFVDQEY